jgi:tetratricopeptide (TPR) repeat protein
MALLYRNKLADAETALARASALDEDQEDVVVHQGYGLLQLAREKPADAARSFTRALELDPDNLISLGGRIQAYEELGRQADAMTDIERSLRIEPDSIDMLQHKARVAAFKGDKEAALAAADTLAASEGQKAYGLSLRGDLLARFGRSEEAAAAYREAIAALDGKIAAATDEDERRGLNHDKISVLIDAGRAPEAIRLASATLRTRPDSATELNQRCWSRVLANVELEAALRDCDLALKNDPENAAVTDSRAWAKLRLGRLDQAIADFDDALRWSPRQSASFYGRGLARLRKGDKAGADKDLAEARRIDFDVDARFRRYGLAPEAGAPAAPAPAGS